MDHGRLCCLPFASFVIALLFAAAIGGSQGFLVGPVLDHADQAVYLAHILLDVGRDPSRPVQLASLAGKFRTENLNTSGFATATNTNTLLDCGQTAGAIPDGYDLGNVLPLGLTESDVMSDLTLNWQVQSGGVILKAGDVVVPEPTTLGLIGIGAIGLLARRRK